MTALTRNSARVTLEAIARIVDRATDTTFDGAIERKLARSFLLAWWNAKKHGGWDPTNLGEMDADSRYDVIIALQYIASGGLHPEHHRADILSILESQSE